MLLEFKEFYDKITAEAGRNYKISVLEEYCKSQDILYLLDFIYNPYITTGISEKKLNKELFMYGTLFIDFTAYNNLKDLLEYLKTHNTGRDEDIITVQETRDTYFIKYKELFNKIVTKNIQLGIDSKTINKVIPGLIPEFNVQLANKYFDNPSIIEGKRFALTTKIDGGRVIAIKENNQVNFYTRQGQKYEGLVDLENEMLNYLPDNICLDGELVAINTSKEETYKNTMKLSRTKDLEKHGLKMLVFDCMSVEEFKNQKCDTPYYLRRHNLEEAFSSACLQKDCELRKEGKYLLAGDIFPLYFEILPVIYDGTDTSKIIDYLNEEVENGEEGIMINVWDAPYDFKRTNNLLKVKKFKDTEVEIIGFEEGTNKLTGTLGAFVCKYKDNEVRVGSGLTDEDRAYFWANRDKFLGKLITVKYFETSVDSKTGLESLRFPIFLRIREDI